MGRLLADKEAYGAWIHEAHHKAKIDAPSGTALMLKRALEETGYALPIDVSSTRAGSIPGTHSVGFDGPAEGLTLTHEVRDRATFAHGALEAARWVTGRKGWFTMRDVLGLGSMKKGGLVMRTPFTGCGTALVTPFDSSGALDEKARSSGWPVDRSSQGIHFLVPCGTTGETPTLSPPRGGGWSSWSSRRPGARSRCWPGPAGTTPRRSWRPRGRCRPPGPRASSR